MALFNFGKKKEKKKKGGSMEVVVVKPERGAVRGLR